MENWRFWYNEIIVPMLNLDLDVIQREDFEQRLKYFLDRMKKMYGKKEDHQEGGKRDPYGDSAGFINEESNVGGIDFKPTFLDMKINRQFNSDLLRRKEYNRYIHNLSGLTPVILGVSLPDKGIITNISVFVDF